MTLRPANDVANEIMEMEYGDDWDYLSPAALPHDIDKIVERHAHCDRIADALTARTREVKDAVIDEAISICATWLANFENLTIKHTSATKYASATVKDIAENIQSIRTRIAALGTEEKTT